MEAVYTCLTTHGYRVYWDRKCAQAGHPLPAYLTDIIGDCKVAVHFLTEHWTGNEWTDYERNIILEYRLKKTLKALGVLLHERVGYEPWLDPTELIRLPNPGVVTVAAAKQICEEVIRLLRPTRK